MKKSLLNDDEKKELEQKEKEEKEDSINISYKHLRKVIYYNFMICLFREGK